MDLSADACRTQVSIERARAADAPLANVRRIAELSAVAWGKQLALAELREGRRERTLRTRLELVALREIGNLQAFALGSENPDRGLSSRACAAG